MRVIWGCFFYLFFTSKIIKMVLKWWGSGADFRGRLKWPSYTTKVHCLWQREKLHPNTLKCLANNSLRRFQGLIWWMIYFPVIRIHTFIHDLVTMPSFSCIEKYLSKDAHIKLKEPVWLQIRSHCSVINLAHVGQPFVAPYGAMWPNGSLTWYGSLSSPNGSRWSYYGCQLCSIFLYLGSLLF